MPRERLERRNNYMDFSFTEEQELLAENLVEFLKALLRNAMSRRYSL